MRDLLRHGRDLVRHGLMLVLMAGTLPGTVFTMSNGHLSLPHSVEELVSVGGVALATEFAAIFTGLYYQALGLRVRACRKREQRDALLAQRKGLVRWFAGVVLASAVMNLIFRTQELGSFPLACVVSAVPAFLLVLFTVVLTPIPPDHEAEAREASQRAMSRVVAVAGDALVRTMGALADGRTLTPEQLKQSQFALAFVGMYADRDQAAGLSYAAQLGAPEATVDAEACDYLTARDITACYPVSLRTAQLWVSRAQGRRKRAGTDSWEAPDHEIRAQHGEPSLQLAAS